MTYPEPLASVDPAQAVSCEFVEAIVVGTSGQRQGAVGGDGCRATWTLDLDRRRRAIGAEPFGGRGALVEAVINDDADAGAISPCERSRWEGCEAAVAVDTDRAPASARI